MSNDNAVVGNTPISGTDTFLWWLSTAEPELIAPFVADRNRYRITGLIVMCTWLFATLAWTYFFSITLSNPWVYLPMGLFMGWVVLSIDRALIKGISPGSKTKFAPLMLRAALALTIGLFMAQPAVLYLFDKEVRMQASIDNETRRKFKQQQLDSLYAGQVVTLTSQKQQLEQQLNSRYSSVLEAQKNFLAETDGTGGSGKVGISTIAKAKKEAYEQLQTDFLQLQNQNQPIIDTLQKQLLGITADKKEQERQFTLLLNHGFLTRIEALQNLVKANQAVAFRYYLIVVILMLIELMPVIIKSMMPSGPYEEAVKQSEASDKLSIEHQHKRKRQIETSLFENGLANDSAIIEDFYTQSSPERKTSTQELVQSWKSQKNEGFAGLLAKFKHRVLG